MSPRQQNKQVVQEFRRRRARQLYAMGIVTALLIAILWKQQHAGIFFGPLSREAVLLIEFFLIAGFIAYTAYNWRCPACGRYLGPSINQPACRRCRTAFQ